MRERHGDDPAALEIVADGLEVLLSLCSEVTR
jgi:hypothetical protein